MPRNDRIIVMRAQRGNLACLELSNQRRDCFANESVIASEARQSRLSGTAKPKERLLRE